VNICPETVSEKSLPLEVTVSEIVSSRYAGHRRPASWDQRLAGIDVVRTSDNSPIKNATIKLCSDGGQSPPQPGWRIVLRDGSAEEGYRWTLYAFS
jgi:hypothetical protein